MESKTMYCKHQLDKPSLEEAQKFVGGNVEVLQCGEVQLLINEEGLYKPELTRNGEATEIAKQYQYAVSPAGIVGNVMILSGDALWQ